MEPFYFKSRGDKLFGVYHPAQDVFSHKSVIICPPVWAEYFRTYRYLRKLADAWSLRGYHVLRFDYFGTGDSEGAWADAGPDRWVADIEAAAAEMLEISGSDSVTLAGLRLGATLALQAAPSIPSSGRVILWDPIVTGKSYITSLEKTHELLVYGPVKLAKSELELSRTELAGLHRVDWIDQRMAAMDLSEIELDGTQEITYIASDEQYRSEAFRRRCEESGVTLQEIVVVDDCDWTTPSESALQSPELYRELEKCL